MGVTSFAPPPKKACVISRCGFLMRVTEKLQKRHKKAARESQKCHKKVTKLSHEKTLETTILSPISSTNVVGRPRLGTP
jgi:hypothetical protein